MSLLTRLAGVRQGEARAVLGAFGAQFGLIAGHTILETARDALFLSRLPASRLALVYVAVALGTLVLSAANAALARQLGQRNAFLLTLLVGAVGTALLYLPTITQPLLFGLYGWSALLGALLTMQFWLFAAQVFTVEQGKRLFGLIAGGGAFGAVVGALVSAAVLPFVHTRLLLLLSAGLFAATAIFFSLVPIGDVEVERPVTVTANAKAPELGLVALIRTTPYLLKMAVFTASGTAAVLLVDYLFKSTAAAHVPGHALGEFLARTYTVLNLIGLTVQLFLTGRILRRLGVVAALLVLPVLLVGGSAAMAIVGGQLALALVTKGADGGLRYSLHRVASELLWMPVSSDTRVRAKALLDTVFGKIAQAAVAGALLLLAAFGLGTPRVLAVMVLVLSVIWIASIGTLSSSYVDLFRKALARGDVDLDTSTTELDLTSIETLLEALSSSENARVIQAMELLNEQRHARLIPALILYHDAEPVLVHALDRVATPDRKDWERLAERLLEHPSDAVRIAAIRALVRANRTDILERAETDPSPAVRAQVWLLGAEADPSESALKELVEADDETARAVRVALLDAIADRPEPRFADLVLRLASDRDPESVQHAARTMTFLADPRFVPWLLPRLATRIGRAVVREALVHQGETAIEALGKALLDPTTSPELRLHLPRTISRFMNQRAADLLLGVLAVDPSGAVRYKALRGLGRLVANQPVKIDRARVERLVRAALSEALRVVAFETVLADANGSPSAGLLLELLHDKRRQALERAFRLLQIVHKAEDIQGVAIAFNSSDKRRRAHALEFLEQLTQVGRARRRRSPSEAAARDDIRELLRLLGEDLPDAERVSRGARFLGPRPASSAEAIATLAADHDVALATLASFHQHEHDPRADPERISLFGRPTPLPEEGAFGAGFGPPSRRDLRRDTKSAALEQQLFLRQFSFGRLVGPIARRLARRTVELRVDPGQAVYKKGAEVKDIFLVESGDVELRAEGQAPWRLNAPSVIGNLDAVGSRVHTRDAIALSPVHAFALPIADWLEALEDDFELANGALVAVSEYVSGISVHTPPDAGFPEPNGSVSNVRDLDFAERILFLRGVDAFAAATVEAVARLAAVVAERSLSPGEVVEVEGEASDTLFLVTGGVVEITRAEPPSVARFAAGSIVGGATAMGVRHYPWSARGATPATLLAIRKEDLGDVTEDHFDLFRSMMTALARERARIVGVNSERNKPRLD